MKKLYICGPLSVLLIVAYGHISSGISNAGEVLSAAPAASSVAALSPSSMTRRQINARDAAAGEPRNSTRLAAASAREPADRDNSTATALSAYLYLHETRDTNVRFQAAAGTATCPE